MARLGDVATYINGYAFKPTDWSDEGIPIIRIQDLTGNSYQANRFKGNYDAKYEVNCGDVLISWSASLGVYVWTGEKAVLNQHIFKVQFDKVEVDKNFFVHQVERILNNASGEAHGATMKHLTKPVFDSLPFYLPNIEEQKKIANELNKVSNLISLRKQQLSKLDELVKSRFIELFGDPIYNEKRWLTDSVENVCSDIYGGGTPSKAHPEYYENGDIPWVSSKDMKSSILYDSQIRINQLGVDNSTAKIVPINSVIMVIRSGILKHTLPVAINAVPITVNQDLKVFVPNQRITSLFLMYLFKMLEKDILSGVRAVTADNIEFNSLKERMIIVPPIDLQLEFVTFVEQIDKSKFEIQKSLEKLETLKKALMQKYFG